MQKPSFTAPTFDFKEAQGQAGNDFTTTTDRNDEFDRRLRSLEDRRINLNTDIFGLFETVSTAPTIVPRDVFDQIKIYKNGTTYRLYWHDGTGWRYATGT